MAWVGRIAASLLLGSGLLVGALPATAQAQALPGEVIGGHQGGFLPDLDEVEFEETFTAGSVGNAVVFEITNTTAFPVSGVALRPQLPAQYLLLEDIAPPSVDLEPGQTAEITATFSVRPDAEDGATDVIGFHFDAESGQTLPIPAYRLMARIKAPEEDEQDQPAPAQCNSAVDEGGDEGGGVTVDLGGFVGKAGFTWEMHRIKDEMTVTLGGIQKTTGCVSGSGTFELDVPPGAGAAVVKVVPNCEQTSGTKWSFTFECPLSSEVTADGTGRPNDGQPGDDQGGGGTGSASSSGTAGGTGAASTALGAPVTPAPTPPPPLGPTGVTVAEAEPNQPLDKAAPLAVGDSVRGTILPRGDADFYPVTLPHQGELTVSFLSAPAGINPAFRVLGTNGRQVWGWQTAPTEGTAFSGWVDLKAPGAYVIEVRDGSSNAESATPYTLRTTFIPTADPAEPNDAIAEATPLAWNAAMASNILPRGDADFFAVTAARQGQISVRFTRSAPNVNMAFRVLNTEGRQVWGWQTAPDEGATWTGWADVAAPGPYIIEVRDGSSNARAPEPYEMVASLDQTADVGEPNEGLEAATPISFGAPVAAAILPRGDADLYRIEAPRQGELTVAFPAMPPELNMAFRVLNTQGRQVWGWQTAPDSGKPWSAWADLNAPGPYILEVRDGSSNARSAQPYQMVATLAQTPDPGEPNDQRDAATPLALGSPMRAAILPRGDADLYRIEAPRQGELTVAFPAMPPELNMAFRVLNTQGRQVWGWQTAPDTGKPWSAWADLSAPGPYILEVRDGSSNARTATPYNMVATLKQTADAGEPNNGVETATPVGLGVPIRAAILPRGDADMYRIEAPRGGMLTVAIGDSPPELNMAFRVLSTEGRQVHGWRTSPAVGAALSESLALPAAGAYIVEVRDGSSNARSPAPYSLTLSIR